MTSTNKILQLSLGGTGTPHGLSYWTSWLGCERAAFLQATAKKNKGLSGKLPMDTGSAGHALLAEYYRPKSEAIDTEAIYWVNRGETTIDYAEEVCQAAADTFRAYRLKHPAKLLGKVDAVEQLYEIKEAFGGLLHTFTFQPDLEVTLTLKQAHDAVPHEFGLNGRYMVDHKFRTRWQQQHEEIDLEDLRFHVYNLAYAQQFPRRVPSFQGTIVNTIYTSGTKAKPHPMRRTLIRYPPPVAMRRRIQSTFERVCSVEALAMEKDLPLQVPMKPDCRTWRSKCSWYGKQCKGY